MALLNGRIPAKNLTRSIVGVDLISSAAKSADRLAAEFRKEMGYDLRATDGYRAIEGHRYAQKEIFLSRYQRAYIQYAPGRVDRRVWNGVAYYRKPGTAAAAVPGTSNHGLGVAVDFASGVNTSFSSPAYVWMTKNAPKHGWSNVEGRAVSEPWHWVHDKARDTQASKRLAIIPSFNAATRREWQRQLGVTADSIFGAGSVSALQRLLNRKSGKGGFSLTRPLVVDGIDGARTWKAVQKLLNAWAKRGEISLKRPLKVTGKRDARTVMALRKSLNANLWE